MLENYQSFFVANDKQDIWRCILNQIKGHGSNIFLGFVPRSLISPRLTVIARIKRFLHQQRLGINKILSNRVKLTNARAVETKSVWVFLCSIYRLSNETVVTLCATFDLPRQCHCLQGITHFCRPKTFITLPKLLAKLRPWSALKDARI